MGCALRGRARPEAVSSTHHAVLSFSAPKGGFLNGDAVGRRRRAGYLGLQLRYRVRAVPFSAGSQLRAVKNGDVQSWSYVSVVPFSAGCGENIMLSSRGPMLVRFPLVRDPSLAR